MKAYVISYTEKGKFQQMTLYVEVPGKLEAFVADLEKKGCEVHEIKLGEQALPTSRRAIRTSERPKA
jgi:hypothetical protein